jgi:hypothetical protein
VAGLVDKSVMRCVAVLAGENAGLKPAVEKEKE